jgi:hypothetical protein
MQVEEPRIFVAAYVNEIVLLKVSAGDGLAALVAPQLGALVIHLVLTTNF